MYKKIDVYQIIDGPPQMLGLGQLPGLPPSPLSRPWL